MIKRRFDSATDRTWPWARGQAKRKAGQRPGDLAITATKPAREASLTADLLVPLGQAIVTGGMGAGVLVALGLELGLTWNAKPWGVWAILALSIACITWLLLLGQTRRLLWAIERLTNSDLDGDGKAGKPKERIVVVNAAKAEQQAKRPTSARAEGFRSFVSLLDVRGTDQRSWERRIGRETYREYRDTLIRLGWAKWRSVQADGKPNERQGWELVADRAWILDRIS